MPYTLEANVLISLITRECNVVQIDIKPQFEFKCLHICIHMHDKYKNDVLDDKIY